MPGTQASVHIKIPGPYQCKAPVPKQWSQEVSLAPNLVLDESSQNDLYYDLLVVRITTEMPSGKKKTLKRDSFIHNMASLLLECA